MRREPFGRFARPMRFEARYDGHLLETRPIHQASDARHGLGAIGNRKRPPRKQEITLCVQVDHHTVDQHASPRRVHHGLPNWLACGSYPRHTACAMRPRGKSWNDAKTVSCSNPAFSGHLLDCAYVIRAEPAWREQYKKNQSCLMLRNGPHHYCHPAVPFIPTIAQAVAIDTGRMSRHSQADGRSCLPPAVEPQKPAPEQPSG